MTQLLTIPGNTVKETVCVGKDSNLQQISRHKADRHCKWLQFVYVVQLVVLLSIYPLVNQLSSQKGIKQVTLGSAAHTFCTSQDEQSAGGTIKVDIDTIDYSSLSKNSLVNNANKNHAKQPLCVKIDVIYYPSLCHARGVIVDNTKQL